MQQSWSAILACSRPPSTTSCSACVSPIGDQGGDIAKTAALAAGYPETVAGVQLNRFCASGLEAVNQARAGPPRLRGPGPRRRRRVDEPGADGLRRRRLGDGPGHRATTGFVPQGIGADLIATLEGWSREDVDAYAAESHHRAAKAWANGYFADAHRARSRTSTA